MSNPSLPNRLRQWIAEETSEAVADCFFPLVENALSDLDCDLSAPASEVRVREVKARLRAADVTPRLMQRAFEESRRAAEVGQPMLEWIRSVQARAGGQKLAGKALARAFVQLEKEPGAAHPDSEKPPSPEQVFAFLLAWEELGGSAGVAAFRERLRAAKGYLPSN